MRPYYQDDHVTIATGVRRDYPDAVEQAADALDEDSLLEQLSRMAGAS